VEEVKIHPTHVLGTLGNDAERCVNCYVMTIKGNLEFLSNPCLKAPSEPGIDQEALSIAKAKAGPFMGKAMALVRAYINAREEVTDPVPDYEVYVVWFSKVLQNWKALVSTTRPDGMYYEVTYDGEKKRAYLDAYKKFDNTTFYDNI